MLDKGAADDVVGSRDSGGDGDAAAGMKRERSASEAYSPQSVASGDGDGDAGGVGLERKDPLKVTLDFLSHVFSSSVPVIFSRICQGHLLRRPFPQGRVQGV